MTRMIRGSVLLAACVGVLSCTGGDPTSGSPGVPDKIVSLPGVVFVDANASQLIAFQLVDDNGGQIPTAWSIGATTAGFTVAVDSSFRPVYNSDGSLTLPAEQTEIRATISGLTPSSGSFTVSAGGKSLTVPVTVVNDYLPATFNTTTPNIGQELVLTMPAGLTLQPGALFQNEEGGDPIVVSRAPDGSSATLLVVPGTAGPIAVLGITPDVCPVSHVEPVYHRQHHRDQHVRLRRDRRPEHGPRGAWCRRSGIPWRSLTSRPYVDQFYKIVLTDTTTVTVNTDWDDHDGDIDQLWLDGSFALIPPFTAATGAAPESSTATFAPGTYYIYANIYDGDPGAWYKFTITTEPNP